MNDMSKVGDQVSGKFPHYKTYAKCQSQAFMTGLFTFIMSSSSAYVAQHLMRKRLPYDRNAFLILPVVVGTLTSYFITRRNTKLCQQMWMMLEDKNLDTGVNTDGKS